MNEEFEDVVASVIARHPFEGRPPWSPRDDEGVAGELQRVVAALAAELVSLGGLRRAELHPPGALPELFLGLH
jgi:hypothetical protein